jgi:hypothetical protein
MKKPEVQPKDFSYRKYFPLTSEHPFTLVNKIQSILEKFPAPPLYHYL